MNVELLEMNNLILSIGARLRQVSLSLAQATGHYREMLSVERDVLLNQYTSLCSRTTTLTA